MTKEQAIKHLKLMQSGARNAIRFTRNDKEINEEERKENIEIYQDQLESLTTAIKALEIVEEFERAQIITGGRLNGRTYAYKCGLEDGKRKALEQQPSEDCVSRQAVLSKAELIELEDGQSFMSIDPEDVKALSPVTPTHCIAEVRFSKDDLREICNERIEIECTHGICKDCTKSKILNDFEGYSIVCSRFGRMAVNPDFYCADFESENK